MLMDINYIDTLTLFTTNFHMTVVPQGWTHITPPPSKSTYQENWFIRVEMATVRYYPKSRMLFFTASVPRLLRNSNCYNVSEFDSDTLQDKVYHILQDVGVTLNTLPNSLLDWQVSRTDLFFHHYVPGGIVKEYLDTYARLRVARFVNTRYKGTVYIMSRLKRHSNSSSCIRIYDKLQEIHDRYYPNDIAEDFEYSMSIDDDVVGIVRFEVQMRRKKLRYEFGKSVPLSAILDQARQEEVINNYIKRMHLTCPILPKEAFRVKVDDSVKFRGQTKRILKEIARAIRAGRNPLKVKRDDGKDITPHQFNYYLRSLYNLGLHIVTSDAINLVPVALLPYTSQ